MTQQYRELPTEDEFKSILIAKLRASEINQEQAAQAAAQYKADVKANGPRLSAEQMDVINTKVAEVRSRFVIPSRPELDEKRIPPSLLEDTRESLIRAEQFRMTDPLQAEYIDGLNPLESFMIGAGGGADRLIRGLTGRKQSEDDKEALGHLKDAKPSAVVGGLAGETAPFVVPGANIAKIGSLPLRAVAATGLGATEGVLLARGEDQDAGKGALVGGAVAGGLELGIPIIGRLGGALFRKLTGSAPKSPIVDAAGKYSDEFLETIGENGLTPDDFLADVQNVVSGQGDDELANAVADTVTAIKSQSGRDFKAIAASPDIDPKVLESAQRLGVAEALPISAMSQNQQFIDLEQGISSIISSEVGAKQTAAIKLMKDKADESIEILGGTIDDAQGLSDRVLSELMTTRQGLDDQAENLYKQIGERVPPQLNVGDVTPLRDYIANQVSIFGDDLSPVDEQLSRLLGTEGKPKLVTYGMIDRERKRIGAQLQGKDKPFGDMASGELKQAYRVLTELQGQFLESVDAGLLPSGADKESLLSMWNGAKGLTQSRKELEESIVKNFGKGGEKAIIPTLEAGVLRIPKGGIANFNRAIEAVPEDMREEAVATALNKVFTAGSGQSQMNMGGFTRWYEKLNRNQTSKDALFKYMSAEGRTRMEDMFNVAQGFSNALLNKKDTGRVATLFDNFDQPNGLLDKLYFGGGAVSPGTSAVVQVVKNAANKEKQSLALTADRLLSSAPFKQMVVSAMDDPSSKAARNALRVLTETKVYNRWVDELPRSARVQVLGAGLIPFLLGEEDQKETGVQP